MTSTQPNALVLRDLDALDVRKLKKDLGQQVRFDEEALSSDKAGEPATVMAVVTLGAMAIKAVAAWFMKERHRGRAVFTVEIEYPDGRREKRTVDLTTSSAQAPPAEVIEALGASLELDPQLVADAITSVP